MGNQIRGLLAEYGIILPLHLSQIRRQLPVLFSEEHPLLTFFSRELYASLYEELCALDERIEAMDERIQGCSLPTNAVRKSRRLRAWDRSLLRRIVAAVADTRAFRNGRELAVWLGLVPRQHSSGDKRDPYLRMLLIHEARSVVYRASAKADSRSRWIAEKQQKLGTTKTGVAVANKNARIIWALLARDEPYRAAA